MDGLGRDSGGGHAACSNEEDASLWLFRSSNCPAVQVDDRGSRQGTVLSGGLPPCARLGQGSISLGSLSPR